VTKEDYTKFAYHNADAFLDKFWGGRSADAELVIIKMYDTVVDFKVNIDNCDNFFVQSISAAEYITWCDTMKLADWVTTDV